MQDKLDPQAAQGATVTVPRSHCEAAEAHGAYDVQCWRSGNIVWRERIENLVPTAAKNDVLNVYLGAGTTAAAWYFGLITSNSYTTGPAASDTMATHPGWKEAGPSFAPNYNETSRPLAVFGPASSGSKATSSAAAFTMIASGTIKGAFLVSNANKDGSTGVLYSAGLFSQGDRTIQSGDVLNISYAASL